MTQGAPAITPEPTECLLYTVKLWRPAVEFVAGSGDPATSSLSKGWSQEDETNPLRTEARKCYTKHMSALFSDTHPKMEALQIQLLWQASPARKMEMLAQLNASARTLALSGLRSRYPRASEAELRRRLAGYLLGEVLASKVYGEINDVARTHCGHD